MARLTLTLTLTLTLALTLTLMTPSMEQEGWLAVEHAEGWPVVSTPTKRAASGVAGNMRNGAAAAETPLSPALRQGAMREGGAASAGGGGGGGGGGGKGGGGKGRGDGRGGAAGKEGEEGVSLLRILAMSRPHMGTVALGLSNPADAPPSLILTHPLALSWP